MKQFLKLILVLAPLVFFTGCLERVVQGNGEGFAGTDIRKELDALVDNFEDPLIQTLDDIANNGLTNGCGCRLGEYCGSLALRTPNQINDIQTQLLDYAPEIAEAVRTQWADMYVNWQDNYPTIKNPQGQDIPVTASIDPGNLIPPLFVKFHYPTAVSLYPTLPGKTVIISRILHEIIHYATPIEDFDNYATIIGQQLADSMSDCVIQELVDKGLFEAHNQSQANQQQTSSRTEPLTCTVSQIDGNPKATVNHHNESIGRSTQTRVLATTNRTARLVSVTGSGGFAGAQTQLSSITFGAPGTHRVIYNFEDFEPDETGTRQQTSCEMMVITESISPSVLIHRSYQRITHDHLLSLSPVHDSNYQYEGAVFYLFPMGQPLGCHATTLYRLAYEYRNVHADGNPATERWETRTFASVTPGSDMHRMGSHPDMYNVRNDGPLGQCCLNQPPRSEALDRIETHAAPMPFRQITGRRRDTNHILSVNPSFFLNAGLCFAY